MSRIGATLKNTGSMTRTPEPEEPATLPPVVVYVLEKEGGGWRPSIYEVPASVLVAHGKRVHTHEPDLKALAWEQIERHWLERTK